MSEHGEEGQTGANQENILNTSGAEEELQEELDSNNPPRCGGLKGDVYWCGGGLFPTTSLKRPKSVLAY